MDYIVISSLVLLLVLSNALWALNTHKLINKLMSRTYWEFKQATQIPKTTSQQLKEALTDVKVKENHPNELDSLDEMIKNILPLG